MRWYEAAGVLPSPVRRENGYREYSDADLSRLTLILALRRLGLTPVEAGQLADRCLEGEATDSALTATLEEQRRAIARQREELERLEIELVDLERTIEAVQARPVPIDVLFVCNGNSSRSQIAEWQNDLMIDSSCETMIMPARFASSSNALCDLARKAASPRWPRLESRPTARRRPPLRRRRR